MIIWLNGTFGVGKTTTAALVAGRSHRVRVFDPETVGSMLRPNLGDHPVTDFRHWEPWRVLTPTVADELARFTGQSLVAPQTVLEEGYWDELTSRLAERGQDVLHVLLDAAPEVVRRRIEQDAVEVTAREWRLRHLPRYAEARAWLTERADLVVDTTELAPEHVAAAVWAAACDRVT